MKDQFSMIATRAVVLGLREEVLQDARWELLDELCAQRAESFSPAWVHAVQFFGQFFKRICFSLSGSPDKILTSQKRGGFSIKYLPCLHSRLL